jgi:hypothetical protein
VREHLDQARELEQGLEPDEPHGRSEPESPVAEAEGQEDAERDPGGEANSEREEDRRH